VFGCGVKEEEGEREGTGGVEVEEEERPLAASLPEVGEGAVEPRLSHRQIHPSTRLAATTACAGGTAQEEACRAS
jgi:hypothetical protein